MVVKMMKWPPWPPLCSKKLEAVITVHRLEGSSSLVKSHDEELRSFVVEIRWKGQKGVSLRSLRHSMKRNFSRVVGLSSEKVVEWNQEFSNVCTLSGYKEDMFFPWEVIFTVSNYVPNQGHKTVACITGVAAINLAKYVPKAVDKKTEIAVPLNVPGTNDTSLSLHLSLSLLKLEALQEYFDEVQRSIMVCVPSSPSSPEPPSMNRNEFPTIKAGLRRVKNFADYVSTRRAKKSSLKDECSDGRISNQSEDSEHKNTSDTDSLDSDDAIAIESEKIEEDAHLRHALSYQELAPLNYVGGLPCTSSFFKGEDECWINYSIQKKDYRGVHVEIYNKHDLIKWQSSKSRILSWRKRKLNFRSPKVKEELLLKRHYEEDGGDDIDYDRRQLSSLDEYNDEKWRKTEETIPTRQPFVSEFSDDSFIAGSWECREFTSRDGQTKLYTQVFFASIDQRSERAAGESACAVLVATIADWLKLNRAEIPIKCEFDTLIRDGSSEWKILCQNKDYMKIFPDKHFDLDTVLQSKIHSISVLPEKSFVGFFIPEEIDCCGGFKFLQDAMSFDTIWEEISKSASELQKGGNDDEPLVYIIGWNDHFFVLKVDHDAYYIIDTLGERLYDGCNKAYILKFDVATKIEKREEIICRGKESCKEYIKCFLAAIPVKELQYEVNKGLKVSMPFHHRLQIEFYYTQLKKSMVQCSTQEDKASCNS